MGHGVTAKLVNDFLGSTQIFTSGISAAVEKKLLREVAGTQLTFSQFKLLKLVALRGPHSLGDVATFLGISHAAASKAVDKLVRRKLLRRAEGQPDRRAIQLSLTGSSRQLLAAYEAARNRKLARLFGQFSAAELHRAAGLLDRLSVGLINHSAPPDELCLQCGVYFRERCLLRDLVRRTCFYEQHKSPEKGAAPSQDSA